MTLSVQCDLCVLNDDSLPPLTGKSFKWIPIATFILWVYQSSACPIGRSSNWETISSFTTTTTRWIHRKYSSPYWTLTAAFPQALTRCPTTYLNYFVIWLSNDRLINIGEIHASSQFSYKRESIYNTCGSTYEYTWVNLYTRGRLYTWGKW